MTAYCLVSKARWNCIIPYRVETNSCGMHIMRDKQVSRVWCWNINTYCYNTYRVFRADKWHDSISSQDEIVSYHIVSKRNRAGSISCRTNKHRVFGEYISSVSCRQVKWQHIVSRWNHIISYRVETNSCGMHIMRDNPASSVWCGNIDTLHYNTYRVFRADKWHDSKSIHIEIEMKFNHTVLCRNELYRMNITSHAGQTRIESLVRKHEYILLQYTSSVSCRQMTWQHIVSKWNWIIPYRVQSNSCGMHIMRDNNLNVSRVRCWNVNTLCYNTYRLCNADKWHDSILSQDDIVSYRIVSERTRAGCISCGKNKHWVFGAET